MYIFDLYIVLKEFIFNYLLRLLITAQAFIYFYYIIFELPFGFQNKTRGLMGNYSYDILDDLTTPGGMVLGIPNLNNFERLHKDFAIKWLLEDKESAGKGEALFTRINAESSSYFTNKTFEPEWRRSSRDILFATNK